MTERIIPLNRFADHQQLQALAQHTADHAAHGVGLPSGGAHQISQAGAGGLFEQGNRLGLLGGESLHGFT